MDTRGSNTCHLHSAMLDLEEDTFSKRALFIQPVEHIKIKMSNSGFCVKLPRLFHIDLKNKTKQNRGFLQCSESPDTHGAWTDRPMPDTKEVAGMRQDSCDN